LTRRTAVAIASGVILTRVVTINRDGG